MKMDRATQEMDVEVTIKRAKQVFVFHWLLLFLSWFFEKITSLRRAYKTSFSVGRRLPGVTFSVGNITVGGTGKTPVVIALAKTFKQEGKKVVVLSRGYKSGLNSNQFGLYQNGSLFLSSGAKNCHADEVRLIHEITGCDSLFGVKRSDAADWYLTQNEAPDVWILDDGYQHLQISRDVNLLLFDYETDLTDERCLPHGYLRESLRSVDACDSILFTRASVSSLPGWVEASPYLKKIIHEKRKEYCFFQNAGYFSISLFKKDKGKVSPCAQGPYTFSKMESADLEEMPLVLVCGIANPERFVREVKEDKISIKRKCIQPDHELFGEKYLTELGRDFPAVLTTEKDFYREPDAFLNAFKFVIIKRIEVQFSQDFKSFCLSKVNTK